MAVHADLDLVLVWIVVGVGNDVGHDFVQGERELEEILGGQPMHRPERFDALGDARDFLEAIAAREGQCLRAHGWSVGAPR